MRSRIWEGRKNFTLLPANLNRSNDETQPSFHLDLSNAMPILHVTWTWRANDMIVDLQGFGLVGYLYFGAMTFSQVFCKSWSKPCLKLHSAIYLSLKNSLQRTCSLQGGGVCEAVLTFSFPLAVFSLAVWYCGAEGSLWKMHQRPGEGSGRIFICRLHRRSEFDYSIFLLTKQIYLPWIISLWAEIRRKNIIFSAEALCF